MRDPDSDLVSRAKAGHKEFFGKLVNRYYEMIYAVSYGVVREREAARDITQDAFLKAYKQLRNFEGRSKFKTWLYRIAFNTAIDYQRRSRKTETIESANPEDEERNKGIIVKDTAPNPRDRAAQLELRERLLGALEQLSEEHRAIILLREWEGMSYEEIADTLGIEIGTVMSRIFYARKKLGEILKLKLPEEER